MEDTEKTFLIENFHFLLQTLMWWQLLGLWDSEHTLGFTY